MSMPQAMKVIGQDVVDRIVDWIMGPAAPGQRAARWAQLAKQPARDNLWRRGQATFRQMTRDASYLTKLHELGTAATTPVRAGAPPLVSSCSRDASGTTGSW